jgi:integrase
MITIDYTKHRPNFQAYRGRSSSNKSPILGTAPSPGHAPSFAEFTGEWWDENAFRWKRSGVVNMRSILNNHLLPQFVDSQVNAISKGQILKFRAQLASLPGRTGKNLSNKRINNILQPLQSILDEAAERYGFVSPFRSIKRLPVRKPDIQPFSLAETWEFIDGVRQDFRNYYTVRFFTGMRTGEIDGLRWRNIDFERGLIYVVESFTYGEMDTTKTPDSVRDIQMSSTVREALLNQNKFTGHGEFVFCNNNGKPLGKDNVSKRIWYPTLEKLGFETRRPYQTRHTAATLWLASGENPEWVAMQLGHSSSQMLFQTYSRYVPNITRKDGSAMEELIRNG